MKDGNIIKEINMRMEIFFSVISPSPSNIYAKDLVKEHCETPRFSLVKRFGNKNIIA